MTGRASFTDMLRAIDDAHLDVYEFRVWMHIWRVGVSWESLRTIAEKCDMSLGKAQQARNGLVERNLLTYKQARGRLGLTAVICSPDEQCSPHEQVQHSDRSLSEQNVHDMNMDVHHMNADVHQVNAILSIPLEDKQLEGGEERPRRTNVTVRETYAANPRLSPPLPQEPVYQNGKNGRTAAPELTPDEIATVNALVTVTGMGGTLNFDKLYPCAQALLAAGYNAGQVERHYSRQPAGFGDWNWYTNYWKGTKDGSMPRLADITETISGAVNHRKTAAATAAAPKIDPVQRWLNKQQQRQQES